MEAAWEYYNNVGNILPDHEAVNADHIKTIAAVDEDAYYYLSEDFTDPYNIIVLIERVPN